MTSIKLMFYRLYNLMLVLVSPVIIGLMLTKKRCQRGLWSRLGLIPVELRNLRKPVIWIHAASLGEVMSIVPLLHVMKERDPQWILVVSTVTETGREVVIDRLEGVALHCYAPVDFWWAVECYVRILKPHLFILVEAEFWPNLLNRLRRHHVPVCLVNGRISSRSFGRYMWVKDLMKNVLRCIDLALMQSMHDAERIGQLGALPDSVHVTGNMKFDQSLVDLHAKQIHVSFRTILRLAEGEVLIVAGSTHAGEEEYLLEAYCEVSIRYPQVVFLLAPRHIERTAKLEELIRHYGFPCIRRSRLGPDLGCASHPCGPRVILLDTRGELPFVYREGCVTFVGGTLVPVGGHNLLEPAQWGKPVLFGPYIDHCRDIACLLLEAGGGIQIQNRDDLVSHFIRLVMYPFEARSMGQKAFEVVEAHRGVVSRNLEWIYRLLEKKNPASPSLSVLETPPIQSQEIFR